MTDTALSAEADRFARRLRLLLDGTVAHDAPIAASTADGRALVGVIAPDGTFGSTVIPLTIGREHRLDLKFSYRCSLAARSPALTVETS